MILFLSVIGGLWVGLIVFYVIAHIVQKVSFNRVFKRVKEKTDKVKENDSQVRQYFERFNGDSALAIVDETPRPVFIGDKEYWLKPLKYRQITRICVLFAQLLEKLQAKGIDLTNADNFFAKIIETSEDDFFVAVAYVLYFSEKPDDDDMDSIKQGVDNTYIYLKNNATLNQLGRVLEVIFLQNDIKRALDGFSRFSKKKV
jgi:hypothetical protein